jgi:hypothetical protein
MSQVRTKAREEVTIREEGGEMTFSFESTLHRNDTTRAYEELSRS